MKVPQYVSQTTPSDQGLGYLSSAGASPSAFGAGIGEGLDSLGIDIKAAQEKAQKRTESIDRFKSLTDLSQFQTSMNDALIEAKRTADPSGKGYVQTAEGIYDKEADNYLSTVPPPLKPEFTARVAEIKKGVIGDSLTFQYQAGDAMFRQGVDDEYQNSLKGLDPKMGGDPSQLEAYRQHMGEIIGATDLSDIEKQDLSRKVNIGLEGVGYKATYAKQLAAGGIPAASGDAIDTVTSQIIGAESGGKAGAKNPNSTASGVGQFLDSTWVQTVRQHRPDLADGKSAAEIIALKTDPTLGREMTKALTQDNAEYLTNRGVQTTPGNLYLAHFLGSGGAVNVLKADPNTPISTVVGQDVVNANPFLKGMTVAQTVAWSDKKMGQAPTITVDSDPAFSNLTYEDRSNLQKDATSEVAAAQAAAAKAAKEAEATKTNALFNGINDGVLGVSDVDAGRQEGWLTDFDSIKKAQDLIKQRDETVNLKGQAFTKLQDDNAVWSPTDDKDRKMLNAAVGKDGIGRISSGDQGYVTNGIVPLTERAHDIPTDVVGTLTGMARSNNQQKAFFALDTLNQLEAADPTAYKARVPDDLASKAEAYRTHKDLYPADELMGIINGGADQQTRQANAILEKEAQTILSSSKEGTTTLQTLVQGVVGSYGGLFSSPALSGVPAFARGLSLDYQTAFTDGYKKFGDQTDADAYAKKILQRSWGVTAVGGGDTLMKYPPEYTGYKPLGGSMDWINSQVRDELKLPADSRFDLVSDDQTKQEFAKWQRGENFIKPTVTLPTTGLIEQGNINLDNRPSVKNSDGSISTVRSMSYENNAGQEVLIPTVSNEGKIMSNHEAIKYWGEKGQFLGKFDNPDNATAYAEALHQSQSQEYTNQPVSYQIVTYDANNVARLSPDRHYFVPTERDTLAETNKFEQDRRLGKLQEAKSRLDYATDVMTQTGTPVPQEYKDEVSKLQKEYDTFAPPPAPTPTTPAYQVPAGAPANLSGLN